MCWRTWAIDQGFWHFRKYEPHTARTGPRTPETPFAHVRMEGRPSCCATGLRSDLRKKYVIHIGEVTLKRKDGEEITLGNVYIPPQGRNHYDELETTERLSMGTERGAFVGDFNWRPIAETASTWLQGRRELPAGHGGRQCGSDTVGPHRVFNADE